jgi:5,10-methylenetetrahydrofolate reductase
VNIPDSPRASARMSNQALSLLIQREVGIDAILHYTCRDRNVLCIQSDLLGAAAVGIRNLICITGDPPKMGNYPDATAVFDVDAIGLVNIVHNLNRGTRSRWQFHRSGNWICDRSGSQSGADRSG